MRRSERAGRVGTRTFGTIVCACECVSLCRYRYDEDQLTWTTCCAGCCAGGWGRRGVRRRDTCIMLLDSDQKQRAGRSRGCRQHEGVALGMTLYTLALIVAASAWHRVEGKRVPGRIVAIVSRAEKQFNLRFSPSRLRQVLVQAALCINTAACLIGSHRVPGQTTASNALENRKPVHTDTTEAKHDSNGGLNGSTEFRRSEDRRGVRLVCWREVSIAKLVCKRPHASGVLAL